MVRLQYDKLFGMDLRGQPEPMMQFILVGADGNFTCYKESIHDGV